MKKILTSLLALCLIGCTLPQMSIGNSPAPLAQTTIDDKGLETTWKTFDLALDAINALGDVGVIVPGTPKGKAVASAIRKVNKSLIAAEHFAAAGSTTDYKTALLEAGSGIQELRDLIGRK